jgi:dnd system-associated protein 4
MRRVRRPKDKEALLNLLIDRERGGPFATYKDILVFAAALGFANGRREPFTQTSEPIDWSVFSGFGDAALVDMISIAMDERLELLAGNHDDDRLTQFEEYANGGLVLIEQRIAIKAEPLDGLLELIQAARTPKSEGADLDWNRLADQLF